jgi:hypothetical protein
MPALGADAHKRVNLAVAIDAAGRAAALGEGTRWGIEGTWNYGRGLAQYLVEGGATLYEANARRAAARLCWPRRPCAGGSSAVLHGEGVRTRPGGYATVTGREGEPIYLSASTGAGDPVAMEASGVE